MYLIKKKRGREGGERGRGWGEGGERGREGEGENERERRERKKERKLDRTVMLLWVYLHKGSSADCTLKE